MTRASWWPAARLVGGVLVLVLLVVQLGAGPFLAGLRSVSVGALLLALVVTMGTTVCCARRWSVVSRALGAEPPTLRTAVAAYYRSQLLNVTLPGGVLGDVHRGASHRLGGGLGTGLKSVAWERSAGMAVQVAATALVVPLALVTSPLRPLLAVLAAGLAVAGWLVLSPVAREVCLLSLGALAGHTLLFLVAARTSGIDLAAATLLPVVLLVLLVAAVPLNVAGWGPREGAAAAAFALVGVGAAQGLAASVVYGVIALVATLPGAALLLLTSREGRVLGRGRTSVTPATDQEVGHG